MLLPIFAKNCSLKNMSTMNISLPESLKEFVDEQVSQRGYSTSSEYLHELIRNEQARQNLRCLLLEGATSAPGSEITEQYFSSLRQRIQNHSK